MIESKEYLGDSVYATFERDMYGVWLTTENGLATGPSNKIFLEPEVFEALCKFWKRFKEQPKAEG